MYDKMEGNFVFPMKDNSVRTFWDIVYSEDKSKGEDMEKNSIPRSNRKVKGETFSPKIGNRKLKKSKSESKKHSITPTLRQRVIIKYRDLKTKTKSKIGGFFMDKTLNKAESILRDKVTDNKWYGKILFAVLDVLPMPNIHEIWKAVQKELPNGTFTEKLKLFWEKVDGVRTVVSIIISVLIAYEYIG